MGLSPDGKLLVAGGGMQLPLCVYELATGREIHRFLCDASTSKISPDGKRLAVAGMTTSPGHVGTIIRIFDLTTGEEKAAYPLGYYAQFTSLVFAPDGRALACCGVQITSCVLDSTTGRILHKLPGWPFRPSFSSDSKLLVYTNASVANSERINLLDMATGRHLHDQPGDLGQITALALSPDGRHLAAGNWLSPAVTLWDTKDGRMMRTFPLKGEKRYVRNVAFSADGQTLAACQPQGFLKLWDVATGGEKQSVQLMDLSAPKGGAVIKGGGVRAFDDLQMSSDFKQVRTTNRLNGNTPMRLATWETATGNEVGEWHLQIQSMRVNWLAEGKAVAMPSQEGLTLMDLSTDQVRWRLSDQGFGLTAASSDGRQLAVAKEKGDRSQPRIIRFPDLRDGHRP
jgi:WD40 repeat protein